MITSLDTSEVIVDNLDRCEFVDLLKKMLQLEQEIRMTPTDGLTHPFLTLTHLLEYQHTCRFVVFKLPIDVIIAYLGLK